MPTEFINIDLDIASKFSLKILNDELDKNPRVFILHHDTTPTDGEYIMRLECYDGGDELKPHEVLNSFFDLIDNLSPEATEVWNASRIKTFDMGFESLGSDATCYQRSIPHDTLLRLANIGATLDLTIYNRNK